MRRHGPGPTKVDCFCGSVPMGTSFILCPVWVIAKKRLGVIRPTVFWGIAGRATCFANSCIGQGDSRCMLRTSADHHGRVGQGFRGTNPQGSRFSLKSRKPRMSRDERVFTSNFFRRGSIMRLSGIEIEVGGLSEQLPTCRHLSYPDM